MVSSSLRSQRAAESLAPDRTDLAEDAPAGLHGPTPGTRRVPAVLGAAVLWTVAWTVVAAAVTGAATALVLVDAGPIVRWGLPVVDALADLASALVLACIVFALVVLPRRQGVSFHPAWQRALDIAAGGAIAWGLLLVVRAILGYGLVAGQAPFTPRFGSDLVMYMTSIELGQYQLAAVLSVAVASSLLISVRSPGGLLVTLALSLVAVTAKAMTGHSAGQTTHEIATSSMVVHLVTAGVWLGGLALLMLLARRLGAQLPDAATRFSAVALAAYIALTGSGVLSAVVRLASPADLVAHPYGRLLLAKIVLLVLLGAAGAVQRRRAVDELHAGGGRRAFLRLIAIEVFLVTAATGLAATMSNSEPPVPDEADIANTTAKQLTDFPLPAPPTPLTVLTTWRLDAAGLMLVLALASLYLWVLLRRTPTQSPGAEAHDTWPARRTLAWLAGCAVTLWATCGAPEVYAPVQFSAHLAKSALLAFVAAPLLVAGRFGDLVRQRITARADGSTGLREIVEARPAGRAAKVLAHPVVLAVLGALLFAGLYLTSALQLGLERPEGRALFPLAALASGIVVALGTQGRTIGRSAPAGIRPRLLAIGGATLVLAAFALLLASRRRVLQVDWFGAMGRTWSADALADQQQAGWVLLVAVLVLGAIHATLTMRRR